MRKILIIFIGVLILAGPAEATCFPPPDKQEKVTLVTDRAIYIVGEQIRFFASVSNAGDINNPAQSQVLYCEVITPDGNKIAGSKYLLSNSSSSGCIEIPANLLSGTYYVRAYTRVMRNYGPGSYGYCQVRIVNPDKRELLSVNTKNGTELQFQQSPVIEFKDELQIVADKVTCSPHDSISVTLQRNMEDQSEIKNLCLSVVPENTLSDLVYIPLKSKKETQAKDYYPETRGLSITGKLTEATTGNPIVDKKVNLSIIGDGRDFMAIRTDSIGRFFFALPGYSGSRDLFLCAEKIDSLKVKLWVDNDFCTTPVNLPAPNFSLTEQERKRVLSMAQNVQISSHFYTDTLLKKQIENTDKIPFYGKPTNIIYIDTYIQLPTLEEYFNELPSEVKVRKRRGISRFDVLGSRGVSLYEPLILVDYVAIDEPSRVLAISPQNIQRIEVVKEDYVKGGQTYGGIISIISRKGDFAGIDLPSAGIFINYNFLTESICQEPGYDQVTSHPDSRNTILWKPGINSKNGSSEKFLFTAPDTPGRYTIVVEEVTIKGDLLRATKTLEVD
jgi:hypothetical protein